VICGLANWTHAYPDIPIGTISPDSIVLNSQGQIKMVHLFTFPPETSIEIWGKLLPYDEVNPKSRPPQNKFYQFQILSRNLNELHKIIVELINKNENELMETIAKGKGYWKLIHEVLIVLNNKAS